MYLQRSHIRQFALHWARAAASVRLRPSRKEPLFAYVHPRPSSVAVGSQYPSKRTSVSVCNPTLDNVGSTRIIFLPTQGRPDFFILHLPDRDILLRFMLYSVNGSVKSLYRRRHHTIQHPHAPTPCCTAPLLSERRRCPECSRQLPPSLSLTVGRRGVQLLCEASRLLAAASDRRRGAMQQQRLKILQ
jgi:hypothetical protein